MTRTILSLILTFATNASAALIYAPENLKPKTAKLVVVIHGCLQSSESMAFGTGWDRIADRENLVILYPQVPAGTNPIDCWNWYLPENQGTHTGQLRVLMDQIRSVRKKYGLKSKTFVTGLSSGAATATGLLACFPKEFAAGAIHSGPPYGFATTQKNAEELLLKSVSLDASPKAPCSPKSFHGDVMIIQGTADTVVNPANADALINEFVGSMTPSVKHASSNGTDFTIKEFNVERKRKVTLVLIDGLPHAWSGANLNLAHAEILGPSGKVPTQIPFFAAKGPSATDLIWDFFNRSN